MTLSSIFKRGFLPIAFLLLLFGSCKKNDLVKDTTENQDELAIAAFKEKFKGQGSTITLIQDQKANGYSIKDGQDNGDISPNIFNNPFFDDARIESIALTNDCNNSYVFTTTVRITIQCSSIRVQTSSASIRIKNSGGAIIYPTTSSPDYVSIPINPLNVENLGPDPVYGGSSSYSYRIRYASPAYPFHEPGHYLFSKAA